MIDNSKMNDSMLAFSFKHSDASELDKAKTIVECYMDNKKEAVKVFGYFNILFSHQVFINSKYNFYEQAD